MVAACPHAARPMHPNESHGLEASVPIREIRGSEDIGFFWLPAGSSRMARRQGGTVARVLPQHAPVEGNRPTTGRDGLGALPSQAAALWTRHSDHAGCLASGPVGAHASGGPPRIPPTPILPASRMPPALDPMARDGHLETPCCLNRF